MKLAILSTVLTIAAIPAAFADPYVATERYIVYGNPNAADVYTGDLNLKDPADREEAAYRINIATDRVCKPFPDIRVLMEYKDWRGCRAEAFNDGIAQLEGRGHLRRGRVETREYQGEPELPPPAEDDDED